jgi:hypothetical protein
MRRNKKDGTVLYRYVPKEIVPNRSEERLPPVPRVRQPKQYRFDESEDRRALMYAMTRFVQNELVDVIGDDMRFVIDQKRLVHSVQRYIDATSTSESSSDLFNVSENNCS